MMDLHLSLRYYEKNHILECCPKLFKIKWEKTEIYSTLATSLTLPFVPRVKLSSRQPSFEIKIF